VLIKQWVVLGVKTGRDAILLVSNDTVREATNVVVFFLEKRCSIVYR
jgi:hypothetical protein